jgi:hypothetical protein
MNKMDEGTGIWRKINIFLKIKLQIENKETVLNGLFNKDTCMDPEWVK